MKQGFFKLAGVLPIIIALGALIAGIVIVFAKGSDNSTSNAATNSSATATPTPGASQAPAQVWLGISGQTASGGKGVAVENVSGGSPADQAGLQSGDVILAIDGKAVNDVQTLASEVTAHVAGDTVTLSVIKNGASNATASPSDVEVTLAPRPTTPTPVPQVSPAVGAPYLGISGGPVSNSGGVGISSVIANSPADKASLAAGDLILEADGTKVNDVPALAAIVTGHKVGDKITLTVVKDGVAHPDGDKTSVTVTLEARPAESSSTPTPAPGSPSAQPWLGISGTTGSTGGVDITGVVSGSPADKAGLQTGDHIAAVDGESIESFSVLADIIANHTSGDVVTLSVVKDGVAHPNNPQTQVRVTLETRPTTVPQSGQALPDIPGLDSLLPALKSLIGGQFQYEDQNGNTVTVAVDVGTIESVSSSQLKIKQANGSEKTYTVNADSDVQSGLANGAEVIVVSKNGVVVRTVSGIAGLLPGGSGFTIPNCTYDQSGIHCDFSDGGGGGIVVPTPAPPSNGAPFGSSGVDGA